MADSSGIASFQFLSYKIDTVNIQVTKNIGTLSMYSILPSNQMNFEVGFRKAGKYLINGVVHYMGGLNIKIQIFDNNKIKILSGDFGIAGLFRPVGDTDRNFEENMVHINIPAILLPYLRSAITTILSQAGFGTVVLPLINVYEIARKNPVEILDYTDSPVLGPRPDKG
ncbi:MAG: protein-export chaperone SecB [Treponema sp.]|jgi:preprotein translocase subunit SecB|nr:protein-export chaperone SecB [Treponema sp.]